MNATSPPAQALLILGSPSPTSRSASLARHALLPLQLAGWQTSTLALNTLPADALCGARTDHPQVRAALAGVAAARLVLIATPIYKAAYSGLLKLFLDLLPPEGLRGKTVWPLATGGSPAHLLALDYALKPVLGALGARDWLDSVYATESQLAPSAEGGHQLDRALAARLERALQPLSLRAPAPRSAEPAWAET